MHTIRSGMNCCGSKLTTKSFSVIQPTRSLSTSTIHTWGNSVSGALGHEKFDEITREPRRLINSKRFQNIACGENFTLALDKEGHLFGWGSGPGSKFESMTPFPIPTDVKMAKIFAGSRHAACIDTEGNLYTWGQQKGGWFSGGGQLGHGDKVSHVEAPMLLKSIQEYGAKVASVACGSEHTLIVTVDGEVLSCGVGEYGRLGNGNAKDAFSPTSLESLLSSNTVITQAAAGSNHSVALSSTGTVYTWGRNDAGQLGFKDTYIDIYSMEEFPRAIDQKYFHNDRVVQIAASNGRSAAVTENGNLYVWGRKQNHFPSRIDTSSSDAYADDDLLVRKVVLGRDSSDRRCAFLLTENRKIKTTVGSAGYQLWSYGDYKSNMLGRPEADRNNNPIPEVVPALADRLVLDVSAGVGHVAAIVADK